MKKIMPLCAAALFTAGVGAGVGVGVLQAQHPATGSGAAAPASVSSSGTPRADSTAADSTGKSGSPRAVSLYRPLEIDHVRPADQRGINMFEPPKERQVPFNGFVLSVGGAFSQEYQALSHRNAAAPVMVDGVDKNRLMAIGHGFNNAVANLTVNAQVAPGIRVALTSYLSSRHHQEAWVKDGYLLIDESPIDNAVLDRLMRYVTIRAGHFEVNYGDAHFRRSDNGNGMYNPFIGNYILDDFTTEIGAEVYARSNGVIAMLGVTGGEVHGQVTAPQARSASVIGKLGVDRMLAEHVRVRITGSFYANNRSASNTLFTGDRGGSAYYDVLENTTSTETANAWSGQIRPGFSNKVHAQVLNPFIKVGNAEFFGNFEVAKGESFTEPGLRNLRQDAVEGVYRFLADRVYLGGRYTTLSGQLLTGVYDDQSVNRYQVGGGWFVTPNILAKAEWVDQRYHDFPLTDIRHGGEFKGLMIQGVIGF